MTVQVCRCESVRVFIWLTSSLTVSSRTPASPVCLVRLLRIFSRRKLTLQAAPSVSRPKAVHRAWGGRLRAWVAGVWVAGVWVAGAWVAGAWGHLGDLLVVGLLGGEVGGRPPP